MQVSKLEGAELDYWVAVIEGKNAKIVKPGDVMNGITLPRDQPEACAVTISKYSEWLSIFSPSRSIVDVERLINTYAVDIMRIDDEEDKWAATVSGKNELVTGYGPTLMTAICRARVQSVYGDEVPDL